MLHLKHLTKEFAGKPLFTGINWHLKKGERVGLVGENGAGKSTLMRIIAGQVEPSGGELQFAKGATVGYLPQDGIVTRGQPLFQEVLRRRTLKVKNRAAQALRLAAQVLERFVQAGGGLLFFRHYYGAEKADAPAVVQRVFFVFNLMLISIALLISLFSLDLFRIMSSPEYWGASKVVPLFG